jgi:hypothetical protein
VGKPVIKWDGKHLPKELKKLPPGRYSLEVIQESTSLTKVEERGILKALSQLDAGQGRSLTEVISQIRGRAARA